MDERDLGDLGLRAGDAVTVRAEHGEMPAVVQAAPCRRGHVQAYWPECNVLLPRKYDPASGEPDYATAVRIERRA
jgi:formylmethanofuran dehydrogenase subunit D